MARGWMITTLFHVVFRCFEFGLSGVDFLVQREEQNNHSTIGSAPSRIEPNMN